MGRIVIELTNRCNLSCQHCFSGRHGGNDDLPLSILDHILAEARAFGFDDLSFTGGDPTLHREFAEVIRLTAEAGYRFSFVTNGWNFTKVYPTLRPYRDQLRSITFSLDGATEKTHDLLRGKGSYRRVLQAMSVCVVEDVPFSNNMVVTSHNRHELELMVQTSMAVRSRGVRFGHLMHSPLTTHQGFDLSPDERKLAEAEIWQLRRKYDFPIAIAPGHHTTDLFPCGTLQDQELNVDCHGNLTKCCHLSGHGPGVGSGDVIGNLAETTFSDAHQRWLEENEESRVAKQRYFAARAFKDTDLFPCWFCSLYYRKTDWLANVDGHAWKEHMHTPLPDSSCAADNSRYLPIVNS